MKDNEDISARKLIDRLVQDPHWGAMHGLLATSFELRPDFLEMDFLPSVFGLGAWDDRSWATRIALERRLCELDAAVIISEARRYRGRPRSLRLDVRPAVSPRGSVLHAKVTLLLFENAVRLIVGSANLTKQGYRENREVVAVLTATPKHRKAAPIIAQGLSGMETALAPWLTDEGGKLIRRASATLQPWLNGATDPDTAFVWSNGQTRLWREFMKLWPAGETIKRITIISPFWSQDAGLTLGAFLTQLRSVATLSANAEIRLLTDAFQNPDGQLVPVLPPGYATQDWNALGVRATAQPVSPEVHAEELGGMEGFTGTRALHAKVVLVEGTRTGLAYLGSGNFTGHGWGFLPGAAEANTEAGLILRRSAQSSDLASLLPDLVGQPILLTEANLHALRAPEPNPSDDPWPEFIQQALLTPVPGRDGELQLRIDMVANAASFLWHARLLDKDGVPGESLFAVGHTQVAAAGTMATPLTTEVLTRLLTDQEILIAWDACPGGRPFPLNVDAPARTALPISPGKQSIEENQLISYYQGRIAWEQLFPDPDAEEHGGSDHSPVASVDSGVDKSRIQSYQIREFVEALAGLNQDLRCANQSEPSMRLALLGPVSPVALAQTILEATKAGLRTPTAAAFQLVEILACLQSASSHPVPDRLRTAWEENLSQAVGRVEQRLEQLLGEHSEVFARNKGFARYRRAILNVQPATAT
jgi:phosphatidylserine/phosphatidylglycerophosphate/cardiolipin synthase-like enzyme